MNFVDARIAIHFAAQTRTLITWQLSGTLRFMATSRPDLPSENLTLRGHGMIDVPRYLHGEYPANELASDNFVFDPRDFRNALGSYATGVTVITAMAIDGKPCGLTCNSFASVSLNPPLVLWSLVLYSPSLAIFQNANHFAVNVLGASQQHLAAKFATRSDDKFSGVDWTPGLGEVPLLADSVANFQCRVADRYFGGDHVIFLGAVEAYAYNRHEPLLFACGDYGRFTGALSKVTAESSS